GGGASCRIWSAAGDVGRSGWNTEVAGNVATCADSVGISVGAAVGRAISARVGSTERVDPKGDETVLTDCWAVFMPELARGLRVSGKRLPGIRSVTSWCVAGNRPTIPAMARMLAAAVTPYHQRRLDLGLYVVITSLAMWAAMGFCPAAKPVS